MDNHSLTEKVALESCPLCGGNRIRPSYIRDGESLGCGDCGCSVHAFHPNAHEKNVERWNTRTLNTEPSEEMPVGVRRVVHELRLSAQVFRDYAQQHQDKATALNPGGSGRSITGDVAERLRKAKRNRERAMACEEALAMFDAALRSSTSGSDQ